MYLASKIRNLAVIGLVALIIVMLGAISSPLAGQAKAKLDGTVLNINKEAIPQAEVQLKHEDSGQMFYFKSNKKGRFSSSFLPSGNYNLTVEKEGYESFTGELKLSPNITQKIKVTLVKEKPEEQKREEEAIAYFKKGTKLSREKKLEEAIQAFQKAVELKEDFFEAYVNLGAFLFQQQKDDEAEKALLKALELRPEESKPKEILADINFEKAKILIQENKLDEALERLKQSYNFRADHAYVNFLLGYLYHEKGMKEEAIKHFEAFLQLAPNAPQVKDVKKLLESLKKTGRNIVLNRGQVLLFASSF
ncbi:MAG: tetratricopeptide repeat protein [Candidatus Aminicenantes bacterium]|nr:tetratricopeptide repeat protein [Candidatus Aminicenantes bacterium]